MPWLRQVTYVNERFSRPWLPHKGSLRASNVSRLTDNYLSRSFPSSRRCAAVFDERPKY